DDIEAYVNRIKPGEPASLGVIDGGAIKGAGEVSPGHALWLECFNRFHQGHRGPATYKITFYKKIGHEYVGRGDIAYDSPERVRASFDAQSEVGSLRPREPSAPLQPRGVNGVPAPAPPSPLDVMMTAMREEREAARLERDREREEARQAKDEERERAAEARREADERARKLEEQVQKMRDEAAARQAAELAELRAEMRQRMNAPPQPTKSIEETVASAVAAALAADRAARPAPTAPQDPAAGLDSFTKMYEGAKTFIKKVERLAGVEDVDDTPSTP